MRFASRFGRSQPPRDVLVFWFERALSHAGTPCPRLSIDLPGLHQNIRTFPVRTR